MVGAGCSEGVAGQRAVLGEHRVKGYRSHVRGAPGHLRRMIGMELGAFEPSVISPII